MPSGGESSRAKVNRGSTATPDLMPFFAFAPAVATVPEASVASFPLLIPSGVAVAWAVRSRGEVA